MAISVSVSYAINKITKSGANLEVMYTLSNTLAPLSRKYFEVFDEATLYAGVADTTTYSDVVSYINSNFYTLTETIMSGFADEARLLILNSIGSTAGTAVTGVATFSQLLNKPEITVGITPFTYIYTWAGI
jgi:hypothetical protein